MSNRWLSLCLFFLFAAGVLSAQSTYTGTANPAGSTPLVYTYKATHNASTRELTVVLTRSGGYDAGWYGGNVVWFAEAGISEATPQGVAVVGRASLTIGAHESTKTVVVQNVDVGQWLVVNVNARHNGTGAAADVLPVPVHFQAGPECPDLPYEFHLVGDDFMGAKYRVFKKASGSDTAELIREVTVGYGQVEKVTGTLFAFCGEITVDKLDRNSTSDFPYVQVTPPNLAPPPPPNIPPPPPPAETGPKPEKPADTPPPPAHPPPPAPPATNPANDGDEAILWMRDIATSNRAIYSRQDAQKTVAQDQLAQAKYQSDRLKGIEEGIDKLVAANEAEAAAKAEAAEKQPNTAEMSDKGLEAANKARNMIPTIGDVTASTYGLAKDAPDFTISFVGYNFNLNPFGSGRFGGVVDWFRTGFAWVVTLLFAVWASRETGSYIRAMTAARQAQGNAVVGGTGAQATALIAAGLITAAFLAALASMVLFVAKDFGAGSVMSLVSVNPYAGFLGTSAWLLDRIFPVGVITACLVMRLGWSSTLQGIYVMFTSIVRFIVP